MVLFHPQAERKKMSNLSDSERALLREMTIACGCAIEGKAMFDDLVREEQYAKQDAENLEALDAMGREFSARISSK